MTESLFLCSGAWNTRSAEDPVKTPLASIDKFRDVATHDFDKQSSVAIIVLRTVVDLKSIKNE